MTIDAEAVAAAEGLSLPTSITDDAETRVVRCPLLDQHIWVGQCWFCEHHGGQDDASERVLCTAPAAKHLA